METTYEIGHEALDGKFSATEVVRAIKKQPSCIAEILIASITETLETHPNPSGIHDALDILRAVAKHLDRHACASPPKAGAGVRRALKTLSAAAKLNATPSKRRKQDEKSHR